MGSQIINKYYNGVEPLKNGKTKSYIEESLYVEDDVVFASTKGSKIVDFYRGKSVFITGGTGFLGRLLIEKLLRACSEIETIYMLVRPKKGKNMEDRMEDIFTDPIFSKLSKSLPKFTHKIVGVKGDVSLPNLGIGSHDRAILTERVNVIFHAAATVRFDEKIRSAVAINVQGTKEVLVLASECKELKSVVHVSTAYTNCPREPPLKIHEKIYTHPYSTEQILELVKDTSDHKLEELTPKLIKSWPNTYAFTKAIAEQTVKEYGQNLPVCIFRPAIVISTYQEPIRGWIDNLYGPSGVMVGAGTGLLRTMQLDGKKHCDLVPADFVVNGLIAASYQNTLSRTDEIPVYNYVSTPECPTTWGNYSMLALKLGINAFPIKSIWYPVVISTKFKLLYVIYHFLYHIIPATLMDLGLLIMGKRPSMLKIYKKIDKFASVLSYFTLHDWEFCNKNVQNLWENLDENDQRVFPFSMAQFDWKHYGEYYYKGLRLYLLKDDLSTLPEALKKRDRLYLAHIILQFVLLALAFKFMCSIYSAVFSI